MLRFLTARLFQAALLLIAVSFIVYMLIGLMPGDPVDLAIMSNPNLTSADAARLKALYGLDRPLIERYLTWAGGALHGDFGYSRLTHEAVLHTLWPRLGNTALLVGFVVPLCLAIALPLGMLAAWQPGSKLDRAINLVSFAGVSLPPFWLGLLLILLFAVTLGWLPAGGTGHDVPWPGRLRYLAMPVATLVALNLGLYTRHIRAALSEALNQDYIRTARAKGVSERAIMWQHALVNAAIPIITIVALDLGALFSGALVTETVFGYLGMGKLIYDSIMGNDFNLALVALLFATLAIIFANLAADIAYALIDPRINYRRRT
jgi:peptide/nickel transport system permease protein